MSFKGMLKIIALVFVFLFLWFAASEQSNVNQARDMDGAWIP